MNTSSINSPVVDLVYSFTVVQTAGTTYRIENRTPYTMYVVDKSVASVADLKNQAQITVLPMNACALAYTGAQYISCCLSADVAQISLPQDVETFIRFTTFLQNESAFEQQTNSAIATYNPASLEVNAIPASEAFQSPAANTQVKLPNAGLDLYGWNGVYFTWRNSLQNAVYGFIDQSEDASLLTGVLTLRYFAGEAGLIYIPRVFRYTRVNLITSPEWSGSVRTSMRRTVSEISPEFQSRHSTIPFYKDYAINAAEARSFFIPVLPPVTRVTVQNNSNNKIFMSRNAQTVDGFNLGIIDYWQLRANALSTFYIEADIAYWLVLANVADANAWTCRITAEFDNHGH